MYINYHKKSQRINVLLQKASTSVDCSPVEISGHGLAVLLMNSNKVKKSRPQICCRMLFEVQFRWYAMIGSGKNT
jgi:hypothetical protein